MAKFATLIYARDSRNELRDAWHKFLYDEIFQWNRMKDPSEKYQSQSEEMNVNSILSEEHTRLKMQPNKFPRITDTTAMQQLPTFADLIEAEEPRQILLANEW